MAENRPTVSKKVLLDEMRLVLKTLYDQARAGQRSRLADTGTLFGERLTLDSLDYFKFLKRYSYVAIDRSDQSLAVTEEGRAIVEQGTTSDFEQELKTHFGKLVEEVADKETAEDEEEEMIDLSDGRETEATAPPAPGTASPPPVEPPRPPPRIVEQRLGEARHEARPSDPKPEPRVDPKKEGVPFPSGGKGEIKYTRYDALGSGGIGTVYRARQSSLAQDLAIKEIKDLFSFFNFLQRSEVLRHFREVVGQMALLNHPLIVKILDQNAEVAHPYFVMEYLPGGNLKDLAGKGPLPLDRVLVLFTQVCHALQAAHQSSVVHGDIKPENILFDVLGNVRVTDFGITRLLQVDTDRPVPQVITGAIGYLSPEQMRPGTSPTVASDIYSLGILFYEMLTGHIPGRRSPLPSETNKEVPKEIDALFDKMTQDKAEDRYPSIDALLADFYGIFKDGRYLGSGRMILYSTPPKP